MTEPKKRSDGRDARASDAPSSGATRRVADLALLPVTLTQQALPKQQVPVYLGIAALAAFGLMEWPVAAAAGLTYEVLRRWPLRAQQPTK